MIDKQDGVFIHNNRAFKDDKNKPRFDLIPPAPLLELAKVYTSGAEEHGEDNWRRGLKWGRVYAAIHRHLNAFWSGEDRDAKSQLSHLLHAAWGCFTLYVYTKTHPELDDRMKGNPGIQCQ